MMDEKCSYWRRPKGKIEGSGQVYTLGAEKVEAQMFILRINGPRP